MFSARGGLLCPVALAMAVWFATTDTFASIGSDKSQDTGSTTPLSIWKLHDDGATHLQSGLKCPSSIGRFRSNGIVVYDQVGLDVGCGYNLEAGTAITIYLTKRMSRSLHDDFKQAQADIPKVFPGAVRISENALPNPSGGNWLNAFFRFPDKRWNSGLWVTDYAGWTFKIRATYSSERTADTMEAMREITKASEPALAHLKSCAGLALQPNLGSQITSEDVLYPVMLMGVAGIVATPVKPEPDPNWCALEGMSQGGYGLLFWRNSVRTAHTYPGIRVTIATMGPSPVFDLHESGFAGDALDKALKRAEDGNKAFVLVGYDDGWPQAYALFDTEPSWRQLAVIVVDILDKKIGTVLYVDPKGTFVLTPNKPEAKVKENR